MLLGLINVEAHAILTSPPARPNQVSCPEPVHRHRRLAVHGFSSLLRRLLLGSASGSEKHESQQTFADQILDRMKNVFGSLRGGLGFRRGGRADSN